MGKAETTYQNKLIKKLVKLFPGCIVQRNNPAETQGIPDLLLLHGRNWAALEVKISEQAPAQPNQPWYVKKMNEMSFAAFIYPENEDEVLRELQHAFGSTG